MLLLGVQHCDSIFFYRLYAKQSYYNILDSSHLLLDYYPLGLHERSSGCEIFLKALKACLTSAD